MLKCKHLMDSVENDDGLRLWIEPVGLTKDLREWCGVNRLLPELAPPVELAAWFDRHPDGYDCFRRQYRGWLRQPKHQMLLDALARAMPHQNITLLHQGSHPSQNAAMTLMEIVTEQRAAVMGLTPA